MRFQPAPGFLLSALADVISFEPSRSRDVSATPAVRRDRKAPSDNAGASCRPWVLAREGQDDLANSATTAPKPGLVGCSSSFHVFL